MDKEFSEISKLVTSISDSTWEFVSGKNKTSNALNIDKKLQKLYKVNKAYGRRQWRHLLTSCRFSASKDNSYVTDTIILIGLKLKDLMSQKLLSRTVVTRCKIDKVAFLISSRTKNKTDLLPSDQLAKEHVDCLKQMIQHMGMHDIYADFVRHKNLLYLAEINDELAATLEEHMLKKARRYKSFYNLVRYMESFPKADKKRFFIEIFKYKNFYNAKIAIENLKKHPELQKYFLLL